MQQLLLPHPPAIALPGCSNSAKRTHRRVAHNRSCAGAWPQQQQHQFQPGNLLRVVACSSTEQATPIPSSDSPDTDSPTPADSPQQPALSQVQQAEQQAEIAVEVEKTIPQDLPEAEKDTLRKERISQQESLRRERIGKANKGKVTWNKGRKHRPGRGCLWQAGPPACCLVCVHKQHTSSLWWCAAPSATSCQASTRSTVEGMCLPQQCAPHHKARG